jgi:hypothetical protein
MSSPSRFSFAATSSRQSINEASRRTVTCQDDLHSDVEIDLIDAGDYEMPIFGGARTQAFTAGTGFCQIGA